MLRTAAECRLEFSAEVLAVGMAQQEFGECLRIRGDIKYFIRAHASVRASRNVADRVSAGLTGGDGGGRKATVQTRGIVDVNIRKVKILPGRHVRYAVRVLLGQLRQRLKLLGIESSTWNLDALHARGVPHGVRALRQLAGRIGNVLNLFAVVPFAIVIALTVDSSSKPRLGE